MSLWQRFELRNASFAAAIITVLLLCVSLFASPAHKKLPAHPINLNTATVERLEELPGIGPVTAKKIIEFREKSGPFRKVEDLLAIPRITKARLGKLRPYVTVKPGRPDKASKAPASQKPQQVRN